MGARTTNRFISLNYNRQLVHSVPKFSPKQALSTSWNKQNNSRITCFNISLFVVKTIQKMLFLFAFDKRNVRFLRNKNITCLNSSNSTNICLKIRFSNCLLLASTINIWYLIIFLFTYSHVRLKTKYFYFFWKLIHLNQNYNQISCKSFSSQLKVRLVANTNNWNVCHNLISFVYITSKIKAFFNREYAFYYIFKVKVRLVLLVFNRLTLNKSGQKHYVLAYFNYENYSIKTAYLLCFQQHLG